jgi:isocitrate dehydrogenase kinase/phosphatase
MPGDMFPEELATFALANPSYLKAFKVHHQDLLTASYWQQCQRDVADGIYKDVFPYPDKYRFCDLLKSTKES